MITVYYFWLLITGLWANPHPTSVMIQAKGMNSEVIAVV